MKEHSGLCYEGMKEQHVPQQQTCSCWNVECTDYTDKLPPGAPFIPGPVLGWPSRAQHTHLRSGQRETLLPMTFSFSTTQKRLKFCVKHQNDKMPILRGWQELFLRHICMYVKFNLSVIFLSLYGGAPCLPAWTITEVSFGKKSGLLVV